MTPYSLVREFHTVFGLPVRVNEPLPSFDDDDGRRLRLLRQSLLAEEVEELVSAIEDNSRAPEDRMVAAADALGDIVYIACGTALAYGFELGETLVTNEEIELGDYLDFLESHIRVWGAYVRYCRAEIASDQAAIKQALQELIKNVNSMARSGGIPLDEVFAEIHRSNMSKLDPDTGKPIYRDDGKVLKGRNYMPPDIAGVMKRLGRLP